MGARQRRITDAGAREGGEGIKGSQGGWSGVSGQWRHGPGGRSGQGGIPTTCNDSKGVEWASNETCFGPESALFDPIGGLDPRYPKRYWFRS